MLTRSPRQREARVDVEKAMQAAGARKASATEAESVLSAMDVKYRRKDVWGVRIETCVPDELTIGVRARMTRSYRPAGAARQPGDRACRLRLSTSKVIQRAASHRRHAGYDSGVSPAPRPIPTVPRGRLRRRGRGSRAFDRTPPTSSR